MCVACLIKMTRVEFCFQSGLEHLKEKKTLYHKFPYEEQNRVCV